MINSLTPCLWVTVSMLLWVVEQPSSFRGASNPASFSGTLASTWDSGPKLELQTIHWIQARRKPLLEPYPG